MNDQVFAVVEFTDGVAIIQTEWATFGENNTIVSSFYPPHKSEKELKRILQTPHCKRDIRWCSDAKGTPYTVIKHVRNATTLEDAVKKRDFYVDGISEVETDDNLNMQNLKDSRHSRKVKTLSSDFTDGEHGSNGTTTKRTFTSQLKNLNKNTSERQSEKTASTAKTANFSEEEIAVEITEKILTVDQIVRPENYGSTSKETGTNDNRSEEALVQDLHQGRDQNGQQEIPNYEELIRSEHVNAARGKKRRSSRFCDDPREIANWDMSPKDVCLFKKINTLGVICEYVATQVGTARPQEELNYFNEDEGLSDFPIKTEEDFNQIKGKLDDKHYYKKVVKSIIGLGKLRNLSMTVKSLMKKLLCPEAGTLFTFQGRGGKKIPFKGSLLHGVVVQSSRFLHKNETQANVDNWIEDWLVHCKDTIKRAKKQEEKRQEKEAAQHCSFPDFDAENSE